MFTHLHLHTEYSLLDGLIKIKPLAKKVKDLGMNSCAMTDHGVMFGLYEFYSEFHNLGMKPIIGCEVYVANRTRFDKDPKLDRKRYHLTLLAKNIEGYRNLLKIVSAGHIEGMYYKPRVDRELLEKHGKGIIVLTGCLAGAVNRAFLHDDERTAYEWVDFYKAYFDNVYVEVQRNGVEEAEAQIPKLIKLAEDKSLPIVATCDSHYLNKEDSNIQEISWCIRDAKLLADPNRKKKWGDDFYVKSDAEMKELWKDYPQAIKATEEIAEMVEDYTIKHTRVQPVYPDLKKGMTAQTQLKKICFEGAAKRYKEITPTIEERLNYELQVIHDKGYDDYFLIVSDFLNWAKNKGYQVGVRGSVGGSLVAFTSGISDVDPIKWELYFERFLNPQRPSPPDIDSDLQDDKRDEIVAYVRNKYGASQMAAICALGRMKTRAAIRDIARVMGIDLAVADKLSKLVTVKFGKVSPIADMMEKSEEFRNIVNASEDLQELVEVVKKIENMSRHISTHACGILITPSEVVNYVPLTLDREGRVMTQLEGKPLEEMGLMKFDFLGLANLTIIKNGLNLIEQYHNIQIDPWKIPEDDKKTFELLQRGDTTAVFQLESEGMKKYLRDLHPTTLDDICFMCAAYRPGPMQFIPDYIECKHGRKKPEYLIPELVPILEKTYGYAIYQEQVIRIAVDIAGYTMGEADLLRRAMGKKIKEIMEQERVRFVEGCIKKGYKKEIGDKLFDYMMPFADYGFNKSHAAQYAYIAYQTAYLKAHYPIEFMAGLMESNLASADKLKRDIQECASMGIKVLKPDVNKSEVLFTIEENKSERCIRFGLGGIKNASKKALEKIVEERKQNGSFRNLDDLIGRVGCENLTKKTIECLIQIGAMDNYGGRNQLLSVLPIVWSKFTRSKVTTNQVSLFAATKETKVFEATKLPIATQETNKQKIAWENELLGTFFSEHPLSFILELVDNKTVVDIEKIKEFEDGSKVNFFGIMSRMKKILTKKDSKPMAFLTFEDIQEKMEGVLFTTVFQKVESLLKEGEFFLISGRVSVRDGEKSISINDLVPIDPGNKEDIISKISMIPIEKEKKQSETKKKKKLVFIDISKEKDKDILEKIKDLFLTNPGDTEVAIRFFAEDRVVSKRLKTKIKLSPMVMGVIDKYVVKD